MKIENLTMNIGIKFNRPIDKEKDFISVGGFEMTMNGRNVQFDFIQHYGNVYGAEDKYCEFELLYPDVEAFPLIAEATERDLKTITKIIECFVYTGEDSDLEVDEIEHIIFYGNDNVFPVSIKVLDEYNIRLYESK